jgi:hypothetical protein
MSTRPTFVVIGAMKAGTTSLWRYLGDHPDVFMPEEKEPDYFVAEKTWSRGPEWYESLFVDGESCAARGEASTNYAKYPLFQGVPARIASMLPDVKVLYVLREPIERIVSHYRHALRAGWEKAPLEQAIECDPQYVYVSSYAMQAEQYLDWFDRSQLMIVRADDLRLDRGATIERIYAFIGADPSWRPSALEAELHGAGSDPTRRSGIALLDRVPGRRAARWLVPPPLRRAYHRASALDHPDRLALSAEARRRLIDRLRPDLVRLGAIVEPDLPNFDAWGLL